MAAGDQMALHKVKARPAWAIHPGALRVTRMLNDPDLTVNLTHTLWLTLTLTLTPTLALPSGEPVAVVRNRAHRR